MIPRSTPSQFGRTAGDALRFLDQAAVVLVSVRVGLDWPCGYLIMPPDAVRPAIEPYPGDSVLPCEFEPAIRQLTLGSLLAINHMLEAA